MRLSKFIEMHLVEELNLFNVRLSIEKFNGIQSRMD